MRALLAKRSAQPRKGTTMSRWPHVVRRGQVGLAALLITLLGCASGVPSDQSASEGSVGQGRLAGETRIGTAIAVAQRAFPDGAAAVYLARQDEPADALVAGSLTDGPVLLVPACGPVPHDVVDEIMRLAPDEVVALGGERAVCGELVDAVMDAIGASEDDRDIVPLPSWPGPGGDEAPSEGFLHGSAEVDGGCVWISVTEQDEGPRGAIRWPEGFGARFDPLELIGPDNTVIAREGDYLVMAGGGGYAVGPDTDQRCLFGSDEAFQVKYGSVRKADPPE